MSTPDILGTVARLGLDVLSMLLLVGWLQRGAPVAPERASWLVGVASGAIGAFAITLECPADAIVHVGVWHVGIVLVAGLIGRLAVPPLLRW